MIHALLVAALLLVVAALLWLNVWLVLWVVCSLRDHRAEQRASDLMPHLIRAHKELRRFRPQLERLKRTAAKVQRALWGRTN